jgi:hypothetical protein
MNWLQGIYNLLSALIGGGIAIYSESRRFRRSDAARRSRAAFEVYAEFMAAFHIALKANERHFEQIVLKNERNWEYKESESEYRERSNAEARFQKIAWRLRVHERDARQKERLEQIAKAFDHDIEEFDLVDDIASNYPKTAAGLRKKAAEIIDFMQKLNDA